MIARFRFMLCSFSIESYYFHIKEMIICASTKRKWGSPIFQYHKALCTHCYSSFLSSSLPSSLPFIFPSLQRDMAVRKDVKLVVKAWHLGELLRRSLAVRIHSKAPRLLILRQLYLTGIQPSVPGFLVVLEKPGTWSFVQDVP